ncbi:MAG: hypothetical protein QF408_14220, partial [Pirellulales bacterium]|nr:hypothetical protein [Pirellulales bacterium]
GMILDRPANVRKAVFDSRHVGHIAHVQITEWFPRRCLTTSCNFKWPVPWKEKWPNNMKLSGRGRNGFTPSRRFAVGPGVDRSLDVCFYR